MALSYNSGGLLDLNTGVDTEVRYRLITGDGVVASTCTAAWTAGAANVTITTTSGATFSSSRDYYFRLGVDSGANASGTLYKFRGSNVTGSGTSRTVAVSNIDPPLPTAVADSTGYTVYEVHTLKDVINLMNQSATTRANFGISSIDVEDVATHYRATINLDATSLTEHIVVMLAARIRNIDEQEVVIEVNNETPIGSDAKVWNLHLSGSTSDADTRSNVFIGRTRGTTLTGSLKVQYNTSLGRGRIAIRPFDVGGDHRRMAFLGGHAGHFETVSGSAPAVSIHFNSNEFFSGNNSTRTDFDFLNLGMTGAASYDLRYNGERPSGTGFPHNAALNYSFYDGSQIRSYVESNGNRSYELRPAMTTTEDSVSGASIRQFPRIYLASLYRPESNSTNVIHPAPTGSAITWIADDYPFPKWGVVSPVTSNGVGLSNRNFLFRDPRFPNKEFENIRAWRANSGNGWYSTGRTVTGVSNGYLMRRRNSPAITATHLSYTSSDYHTSPMDVFNHNVQNYAVAIDSDTSGNNGIDYMWGVRPTGNNSATTFIGEDNVYYEGSYTEYVADRGKPVVVNTIQPWQSASATFLRRSVLNYDEDFYADYYADSERPIQYGTITPASGTPHITWSADFETVTFDSEMNYSEIVSTIASAPHVVHHDWISFTDVNKRLNTAYSGANGFFGYVHQLGGQLMTVSGNVLTFTEKDSENPTNVALSSLPVIDSGAEHTVNTLRLTHGRFDLSGQEWVAATNGQLDGNVYNPRTFSTLADAGANSSITGMAFNGTLKIVALTNQFLTLTDCTIAEGGSLTIERSLGSGTITVFGAPTGTVAGAGVVLRKIVTASFTSDPAGDSTLPWAAANFDSEMAINFAAYSGTSIVNARSTNTPLTNPTPTLSRSNYTLTYTFSIDPSHNLYYAFAARQGTEGVWYAPIQGNTELANAITHTVTQQQSEIAPVAYQTGTPQDTHETFIRDTDVVRDLGTGVASNTNVMSITISNVGIAGDINDGKYIHRLIQQKTNYLRNVAKGAYPLNGFVVTVAGVTYSNQFVEWQKNVANTNIVAYDIETLDTSNQGVQFAITTNSTQTYVQWNGPTNVAIVTGAVLQNFALRTQVNAIGNLISDTPPGAPPGVWTDY